MLKLYNTSTKTLVTFKPLQKNKVSMYLCGPTVYDNAHLGHGRSACAFDVIRRYLIYKGYEVIFISNYTDIDDKMIKRANEEKITVKELADKIIPEYEKDYSALNILKPNKQPKATEHIETMIKMVKALEEKGVAYELTDGVYFDITKFSNYGKLSGQNLEELQAGARITKDEKKKNPQDFVLWKKSKENEPSWDSPFGAGRPGWHIECSAMNFDIFGETIDIHGGGLDLIFPHHECEIAQSESYTGKTFVKYWLHNGFVKVDNEKMSKSLGNFFLLKDIFKKYDPLVVRYLLISQHYRNPIDFSDTVLNQAKNSLKRIQEFVFRLDNYKNYSAQSFVNLQQILNSGKENFEKYMDNDFDTSGALSALFELIKEVNKLIDEQKLTQNDIKEIKNLTKKFDSVFGILKTTADEKLPEEITNLIKEREKYRQEKNWTKADEIRNELLKKGYEIEDSSEGTKCRKI